MSVVVMNLDVVNAEEIVSRDNFGDNAYGSRHQAQIRRRFHFNPTDIRGFEGRMLKVVGGIDEEQNQRSDQSAVNQNS